MRTKVELEAMANRCEEDGLTNVAKEIRALAEEAEPRGVDREALLALADEALQQDQAQQLIPDRSREEELAARKTLLYQYMAKLRSLLSVPAPSADETPAPAGPRTPTADDLDTMQRAADLNVLAKKYEIPVWRIREIIVASHLSEEAEPRGVDVDALQAFVAKWGDGDSQKILDDIFGSLPPDGVEAYNKDLLELRVRMASSVPTPGVLRSAPAQTLINRLREDTCSEDDEGVLFYDASLADNIIRSLLDTSEEPRGDGLRERLLDAAKLAEEAEEGSRSILRLTSPARTEGLREALTWALPWAEQGIETAAMPTDAKAHSKEELRQAQGALAHPPQQGETP